MTGNIDITAAIIATLGSLLYGLLILLIPGREAETTGASVTIKNPEDCVSYLKGLGYELEQFGEDALMLRCVPADIDLADGRACVEELCENLRNGRAVTYEQVRQELLKTVACKAAIKAGKASQPAELAALAEAVLTGKVKYCPHGRPVSVTYTKTQLDKQFDRIV